MSNTNWTYNEFLAFILIFGAEMDCVLTKEELEYIRSKTNIADIAPIKEKVDGINDMEGLEIIESYRAKYFDTKEKEDKTKRDLEELLNTKGKHGQIEKAAVHIIERLI